MSGHNVTAGNSTHKAEDESEAYYLFLMATSGIFFNGIVILICFARKCLRKLTSAFIIHGSLLDMAKCIYCIPLAMSILTHQPPDFCQLLGGSYVVVISASVFNLVAMVCTESYINSEEPHSRSPGSVCCVVFGIAMIYCGSIILHLGPTIVGGTFDFNKILSQCVFIYGQVPSYVVYVMWVIVTTLSILVACHYLWVLYRNINQQSKRGDPLPVPDTADITFQTSLTSQAWLNGHRQANAKSRVRCFIILLLLFVLTWYPLFLATLADPKFTLPPTVYITLTYVAWSNGAINPLVFLITDNQFNVLKAWFKSGQEGDKYGLAVSLSQHDNLDPATLDRVGCRLCQDDLSDLPTSTSCNGRIGNGGLLRESSLGALSYHQTEWHV